MNELRSLAHRWLAQHRNAAVVTVTRARGSTPRAAGTRMLVDRTAQAGTIGGGHLELQAVAMAREALQSDPSNAGWPAVERRFALGPSLGQCCGGTVEIRIDALDHALLSGWPDDPARFHVVLYGAGHVGRALADQLQRLPCTVDWIDTRDEEFAGWLAGRDGVCPQTIRITVSDVPEAEAGAAPAGAFHLVMTHNHDLDLRICRAVLVAGAFGQLGLIGSRTKHQRFVRRLQEQGVAPQQVARMTCPIGIPGVEGKEPEVIATSVAAQLLLWSS